MAPEPHWTTYLGPLLQFLTALIAGWIAYRFGSIQAKIASRQAETARSKLKFDLFERRLALYNSAYAALDHVVGKGWLEYEAENDFLDSMRALGWLTDEKVVAFVLGDMHRKMRQLSRHTMKIGELTEEHRVNAAVAFPLDEITKQQEMRADLRKYHVGLADVFAPYLKLEH